MGDGRRINRWCLVDQHGSAHLAVIGIERDTKDGHYNYNAVGGTKRNGHNICCLPYLRASLHVLEEAKQALAWFSGWSMA